MPGTAWTAEGAAAWSLYAARLAGIVLTLRAAAILDVWELAGTRPPRHAPGAAGGAATFTRRGPYGWVRHPIYSGWFLVVFAVPSMTATQLVFAIVSSVYLLIGMVFEERSLVRAAPDAYEAYRRRCEMEGDSRGLLSRVGSGSSAGCRPTCTYLRPT